VRRIKDEIAEYVVQLGTDGRLLSLQLEELTGGLSDDLGLVIRDYLPGAIVDRLVSHFGSLQKLLAANIDDLMDVDGVGEGRARLVREGLSRLAESSILERYV
jgi:DNA integrity scanning protein DisA with diadenylate cyclase activity